MSLPASLSVLGEGPVVARALIVHYCGVNLWYFVPRKMQYLKGSRVLMNTKPMLTRVIILGVEGVANLPKWHSGSLKFVGRLMDRIS